MIRKLADAIIKLESIIDWRNSEKLILKIREKISYLQYEEQKEQYRCQNLCQYCGGTFKGFFTKRCSRCGKEKDY